MKRTVVLRLTSTELGLIQLTSNLTPQSTSSSEYDQITLLTGVNSNAVCDQQQSRDESKMSHDSLAEYEEAMVYSRGDGSSVQRACFYSDL